MFKRLPVLPARSDSRRRSAQQASRCSKGCRFRLREAIRGGGWRSRLPVVKKGCRFCLREEIHGGGWRSKLLASVKSNSQTNVPSGANNTRSGNDSTANHYAALLAQVQAAQDAAARRAEELARQKQQAAQAAYDKNMGYLNEAYANRNNLLQQNYNDALAQLQASYDSGARGVNRNADSAQQQAYINYMMSKRDLPQALAAQGLTGGMSESALAGMYNSYGNNRNTIDRGRNESLAALLDTLNSNRSSALQSYNSQLSAAEQQKMAYQMQLEQALANGSAEILQNKYDTLQNLDNAYAQQILALQQAAAQAAQKRW